MSSPLPVRLFHGAWKRGEDGHWTFHRKPSDLGYTVLVKRNEKIEDLESIIRARYNLNAEIPLALAYHPPMWLLEPEGTRRPPTTITSTETVEAMMGIRSWFAELVLCASSELKMVLITSFFAKQLSPLGEQLLSSQKELVASQEVLEEIFNEEERLAIYRAHYEIEKAKNEGRENGSSSAAGTGEVNNEGRMLLTLQLNPSSEGRRTCGRGKTIEE
ncbi:hypothetical protein Bca101_042012 [Brassica carinata]